MGHLADLIIIICGVIFIQRVLGLAAVIAIMFLYLLVG